MDLLSSVWNLHLGALNFSILCSRPEDASIYGFQVGSESTNFQMSPIKTYKNHHRNYHKNGEVGHAISHWPRLMWPWWNPPSWAGKNVEISWLVHSLRFTQPPERCGSRQRNANLGGFRENLWWGKQRFFTRKRICRDNIKSGKQLITNPPITYVLTFESNVPCFIRRK
jgi:hypothetical protein